VVQMDPDERYAMRLRARQVAKRFTEEAFARGWIEQVEKLVEMQVGKL
jgi:alpha-1,2-mannosyltransferase